ncbi:replication protein A 70 kDa DNA-binding subunit B-like isoform X2 [Coffea arabica]|uniref:Replication protein A 70 kDa DNA-binding subunit B-like isoform X2 n=1 Tax=Coffea arabica TaxID=13443 RepID=A0ABM4USB8_COFAR
MVIPFLSFSTADFLLIIIMICGNCAFAPLFSLFYCSCSFARQKELPHKHHSSFSLAILNLPSFPVYWFGFNLHCCYSRCFLLLLLFGSVVLNFFVQAEMSNLLPIGDIMPDMKNWSCIITVQEKQQVTDSMGTPTKKQKFVFYDSEGSKVEGIIFNADILRMSPMLQVYKRYKISNADVRTIPLKFQTAELTKQWVITSKTVIDEVDGDEDIMPIQFAFTKFADLAEYMDDRSKSVDVLGVVISSLAMKTITKNSKQSSVQKFVLLNEESQTVLLSLWDDFLNNEGQVILNNMQSYPVIIGRRLKVNNYNGVSLSTWFDSALLVDPPIQEARQLKNWAMRNTKSIAEIIDAKSYIKYNPALSLKGDQKTTLICNVTPSQKTAWVKAKLSFEHIFQKYWYMSCAKCYQATAADYEIEFTCNSCKEKGAAMPRCRFDIDLSDDSGVIPASIFGDLAETILTFTGLEAMDHFNQDTVVLAQKCAFDSAKSLMKQRLSTPVTLTVQMLTPRRKQN